MARCGRRQRRRRRLSAIPNLPENVDALDALPVVLGNEMTFRTLLNVVDVLLTPLEEIMDKFHHSKSSFQAETHKYAMNVGNRLRLGLPIQ